MRSVIIPIIIVCLLQLCFITDLSTATWPPVSVDKLCRDADAIVRGRVIAQQPYWDQAQQLVYTEYTIANLYNLAGDQPTTFSVHCQGGYLADRDLGISVSSEAQISVSDELVLFLVQEKPGLQFAAGTMGAYHVRDGFVSRASNPMMNALVDLVTQVEQSLQRHQRKCRLPDNWQELDAITFNLDQLPPSGSIHFDQTENQPDFDADIEYKWRQVPPVVPYYVNLNSGSIPSQGTTVEFLEQIQLGANGWNEVITSDFQFQYAGATDVTDLLAARNNTTNDVYFEYYETGGIGLPPYATAYTQWSSSQGIRKTDFRFNEFWTFRILKEKFSSGIDVRSIAAHEFGHWLQLGHAIDVMYATYQNGDRRRQPGPDDVAGITFLYETVPSPVAVPSNDLRENAILLAPGVELSGTNTSSTYYLDFDDFGDVWYKYSPATDGELEVNMCGSGSVSVDADLWVLESFDVVHIAGTNSGCSWRGTAQVPRFSAEVEAHRNYYIQVKNNNGPGRDFLLELNGPPLYDFNLAQMVGYINGIHTDDSNIDYNNDGNVDVGDIQDLLNP